MLKKYISALLLSISFFALFNCFSASAYLKSDTADSIYAAHGADALEYSKSLFGGNSVHYICFIMSPSPIPVWSSGSPTFYFFFFNSDTDVVISGDSESYSGGMSFGGVYRNIPSSGNPYWTGSYRNDTSGFSYLSNIFNASGPVSVLGFSSVYWYYVDAVGVNVYYNDELVNAPDETPPFEVSVTPDLYEGMTGNTISYPSKSGGTVTDTLYDLHFTVTLGDDFIEHFGNSFIQDNGYSFTCFVVPSNYVSEDIDDMASHSIFNYVYYGKFTGDAYDAEFQSYGENTALIDPTDISGSPPDTSMYWHVGEGFTNVMSVSCNSPVTEFSFNGNSIDYANNPADSYCVVIHACKSATDLRLAGVPSTFYYNDAYEHHFADKGTLVTTDGDEVDYYLQYTWISDKFNYATIPNYAPTSYETQLNAQGLTTENDPFVFTRSPSVVWDDALMYAKDSEGNTNGVNVKGYSLEEWKEVLNSRYWSQNFNSDFGVGDVTDVLNGESGFFGFLTASISILPSWFLTIMGSFFVTLMAIVIIKFLL